MSETTASSSSAEAVVAIFREHVVDTQGLLEDEMANVNTVLDVQEEVLHALRRVTEDRTDLRTRLKIKQSETDQVRRDLENAEAPGANEDLCSYTALVSRAVPCMTGWCSLYCCSDRTTETDACPTCVRGVSVEAFTVFPCLTSPSDGTFELWIDLGRKDVEGCQQVGVSSNASHVATGPGSRRDRRAPCFRGEGCQEYRKALFVCALCLNLVLSRRPPCKIAS